MVIISDFHSEDACSIHARLNLFCSPRPSVRHERWSCIQVRHTEPSDWTRSGLETDLPLHF